MEFPSPPPIPSLHIPSLISWFNKQMDSSFGSQDNRHVPLHRHGLINTQVKVVQNAANDDLHLIHSKILADTVPGMKREKDTKTSD